MLLRKLFPQALALCFALGLFSFSAFAQTGEIRPRITVQNGDADDATFSPDDPIIVSTAGRDDSKPLRANEKTFIAADIHRAVSPSLNKFQPLILAAIDERLGSRYVWGATGPYTFDCSGFVWSIFQSAGINFERGSARTLWSRFAPPAPEEEYRFGTLVFFSNLAHVGIVADEHGFYHASRHHGVVYSPFNDYWLSRIDGFRRVPLPTSQVTD